MKLLGTVVLLLLSVHAVSCKKHAPTPPDGLYIQGAPGQPLVSANRYGRVRDLPLGERVAPTRSRLFSESNKNDRYQLFVIYPLQKAPCDAGLLVTGGAILESESYGSSGEGCDFSFELTQGQATASAALLGVPRRDRAPVGERVQGRFSLPASSYASGDPVVVLLTIDNPSDAPTVFLARRNCQFSFQIRRNGELVKPTHADESCSGFGSSTELAAGAHVEMRAPIAGAAEVASWADVSKPGHYAVECAYETELTRTRGRSDDEIPWTRSFAGKIEFDVR